MAKARTKKTTQPPASITIDVPITLDFPFGEGRILRHTFKPQHGPYHIVPDSAQELPVKGSHKTMTVSAWKAYCMALKKK